VGEGGIDMGRRRRRRLRRQPFGVNDVYVD
jgi:hypothetical protein